MQKELDKLKNEVTERIHHIFMSKYLGNKSKFAKVVGCNEKTLRLLFENNQGMTLNLLFKIAHALDTNPSELLKGLKLNSEMSNE